MYNNAQVKEIFDREAILIGTSDGIPYYRVVELFGKVAADFAKHMGHKHGVELYGIGEDYTICYFTLQGIQNTATYANIAEIRDSGVKGYEVDGEGDNDD